MKRTPLTFVVVALLSLGSGFFISRTLLVPESANGPTVATVPDPGPVLNDVIGMQRPDFSLADLEGRLRTMSEWDGKVVAVNFWASWCAPCLTEIPELVDLQTRYGERGFQIVGIALQKPDELGEFVKQYKMNYPVMAGEAPVIEIAENFGNIVGALPYTAIIDRQGKIVFVKAGPVTGHEVESIINPLL